MALNQGVGHPAVQNITRGEMESLLQEQLFVTEHRMRGLVSQVVRESFQELNDLRTSLQTMASKEGTLLSTFCAC